MNAYVVPVTVGGSNQRFGTNRSSKRAQGVVVAIGAAMAMCLMIGAAMEDRNMVPVSMADTQTLSKQQALKQLSGVLSSKEINYEVARKAVQGLAVHMQVLAVKFAAQALSDSPTTTDLQECANKDSYASIMTSFAALASNISASNSSLYAREVALKADADSAKSSWLSAQSTFRTAQSTKDSAKQAATYADGMYNKYETAVSVGQAQFDTDKPKLDQEVTQLKAELPVLQEVLGLISSLAGGAAAKANQKAILKLAKSKVLSLVPPRGDSHMAKAVKQLKSVLAETATSATAANMVAVVQELQTQCETRIEEISVQISAMESQLAADRASKSEWEQKMVDLSDEHDAALNNEQTADLTRNSLGGTYMVKDESYQNFHASFEEEMAQLKKESFAVNTVLVKIQEFIASC